MSSEASMEIPMIIDDIEPQSITVEGNESEKTNSPKRRVKILPRYLRSSQGSCHDFCKYGHKHGTEVTERVPIRTFLKVKRAEQRAIKAGVSAEKNSKSTDSVKEDLINPNPKPDRSFLAEQEIFETKKCKESEVVSRTRKKIRSKEVGVLSEKKTLVRRSSNRSISKVSNFAITNSTKDRNEAENVELAKEIIDEDVPEKTLYVIESTIENSALEPSQDDSNTTTQSSQSSPSQRNSRANRSPIQASRSPPSVSLVKKGIRSLKTEAKPKKPGSFSSRVYPSNNSKGKNGISSLDQSKVTEKNKNKKIVDSKLESKTTINKKFERKNSGGRRIGILGSENKSVNAQKLKFRRGTILDLKTENNPAPRRLKFRPVKFIGEDKNSKDGDQRTSIRAKELSGTKSKAEKLISRNQSPKTITNGITRRSLRRNENGVVEGNSVGSKTVLERFILRNSSVDASTIPRRSFKRSKGSGSGDVNAKTSSEKVVLRHQNVAEKKEVQSLFNNVIEETASKLVEARKSKVKALVGAFETVISLQDNRVSGTVTGTANASGT